ncbi:MAG: hypothetical protein ACI81O_002183, partial [Cyclobacteriaceae bacterium]
LLGEPQSALILYNCRGGKIPLQLYKINALRPRVSPYAIDSKFAASSIIHARLIV